MEQKKFKALAMAGLLGCAINSTAQVSQLNNTIITPGPYIGCDAGSNQPLRLTTIPNLAIEFRTANLQRLRLNPTINTSINGFAAAPRNGFLLLSGQPDAFTNVNSLAPFSRLHLVDDVGAVDPLAYAQVFGYRPWMRNGVTFTGNNDQGYLGQKHNAVDVTDMVIQWSDNAQNSPSGTDRLKFVFTSGFTGAATGSRSLDGLEAMRMFPVNDQNVNVGIGDFAPPAVGDPTERLDMLSGRLRIRQLPATPAANTLTMVLVVDDAAAPSGERGVVKWRDASTIGGCASGWNLIGNNPATAYAGNPCPPQAANLVGIGTNSPTAKLHVVRSVAVAGQNIGVLSTVGVGTAGVTALDGLANSPSANSNVGVRGIATSGANTFGASLSATNGTASNNGAQIFAIGGTVTYGVHVQASSATTENRGFNTIVSGSGTSTNMAFRANVSGGSQNYGIWTNVPAGAPHWAAYFEGRAHCTSGTWTSSDENLKTNVEDLVNATELLMAIEPKTYRYNSEEYGFIGVDDSPQIGLLAQNVETVLPELVTEVIRAVEYDSTGSVLHPELRYKAIRYEGLIPVLVGAIKDQQNTHATQAQELQALRTAVEDQRGRLDQLEQLLAACCDRPDGSMITPQDELHKANPQAERLLRMNPNPFTDQTTVRYTLERGGRVSLLVHGSAGQHIQVLQEATMEQGEFSQVWHTSHLAPGIYYVTLLLDGEPLVKRAVKVN